MTSHEAAILIKAMLYEQGYTIHNILQGEKCRLGIFKDII